MASVWARSYLRNMGYDDKDIDYDSNEKALTLKGKPILYGVTPNSEGKAMVDQNALDNAVNKGKQNDYMKQYEAAISKPVQPFTYDINSIKQDPLYTSQLSSFAADQNRQTDNTLVRLGKRGIGNSSSAVSAENAGANNITNYANEKLAPQVIAQKYQQWLDTNAAQDRQNQNLLAMGNMYGQQADSALQRSAEARQANIDNAKALSEAYGFGVLPKESGEELFKQVEGQPTLKALAEQRQKQGEQRQYFQELVSASDKLGYIMPELANMIGVQPYTSTLSAQKELTDAKYKMGMLGVSQQNAATSSRNADTSAARLSFDKEKSSSSQTIKSTDYKTSPEFAQDIAYIKANPKDAAVDLESSSEAFISQYGYDGYLALRKAAGLD